jgi:ABC-type lipoprotein export system ATPase subunit
MHLAGSLVNTLSGGERQRTAIARSLINRPLYLFADEPTAHQDQESAKQVMTLMEQCANRNAVVVVATHEVGLEKWPGSPVKFRLDNGSLFPETI